MDNTIIKLVKAIAAQVARMVVRMVARMLAWHPRVMAVANWKSVT